MYFAFFVRDGSLNTDFYELNLELVLQIVRRSNNTKKETRLIVNI